MTTTVYTTKSADPAWTTKRMVDAFNGVSVLLVGDKAFYDTPEDALQQNIDMGVEYPTVLVRVTFEVVE